MSENLNIEKIEKKFNEILQKKWRHLDHVNLEDVVIKNFVDYGASVILGRAIPDLRDGLKPSQRRVLFAMKNLGLGYTGGFKKSARITGDTIGKYHPHGDVAAYETMINMAQPWKKNLPLIDGQGNWGSIDGDSAAAQRYTEARFTKYGYMMFNDIDKNIVDFVPNYDGTELEPKVLPCPYPNVLINGVPQGSVAVGMASIILPHNSTEIMNALIALLEARKQDKEFTVDDVYEYIKAPDFPTGGIVYNLGDMKKIIETGQGTVRIRAKHHIEKNGRKYSIVITEIPFGKLKSKIIEQIADLRRELNKKDKKAKISDFDKKILQNITNIRDESNKEGIRIVIELKSSVQDPEMVWNYLIKNTYLDTSISYNSIVVDEIEKNGEKKLVPKKYGILDILKRYLDFREELQTRKWTYIKEKTEARLHIIEGLLKAIDIIDEIIAEIKDSKDSKEALKRLVNKFEFSEIQAKAIIDMRLARLTGIEKGVLEKERKDLNEILEKANKILTNRSYFYRVLKDDLKKVAKEIAQERKTEIRYDIGNVNMEDLVPNEECVIYLTNKGYLKRIPANQINKQNKGTKGKKGITLTEDDFIQKVFNTMSHSLLLFIMKSGMVYATKAYNIPTNDKGTYLENIMEILPEDKIVSVVEVNNFDENKLLIMVTKNGLIKATKLSEYKGSLRKSGLIGIKLREGDKVINANIINADNNQDVMILTQNGKCIRFALSDVSIVGRNSIGVRGISLKDNDEVRSATFVKNGDNILTIADNALGKVSNEEVYRKQRRAGTGSNCIKLSQGAKAIALINYNPENIDSDLICVTKNGIINKIDLDSIRVTGRNTKGVKLMSLRDGDKLIEAVLASKNEENKELTVSNVEENKETLFD
jgi:DNA gyrase subunit A